MSTCMNIIQVRFDSICRVSWIIAETVNDVFDALKAFFIQMVVHSMDVYRFLVLLLVAAI